MHFIVYFLICVSLDLRNTNSFKGQDKNTYKSKANVNRKMLEKTDKVIEHETEARRVWDQKTD